MQRDRLAWDVLSPDQQEQLITEHLTYEVRMLVVGAELLTREEALRDERRVALEAFLLHARLLHEFLVSCPVDPLHYWSGLAAWRTARA